MFKDKDVTQEDIYNECYPPTDSNKLIAEFWGMKLGDDKSVFYDDAENLHPPTSVDELQFHTSWDWLMPVIEKCLVGEAEQSEEISNTTIKNIYESICNQDISFAYKSVIQFIKQLKQE